MAKIKKSNGIGAGSASQAYHRNRRFQSHSLILRSLWVAAFAFVLSACSAATSTPAPNSAALATLVPQSTEAPTQATLPTATTAVQPTSVPTTASTPAAASSQLVTTSLDPCTLISNQEASTLTGASFGQGEEGSTPQGLKTCTYGANTMNIFTIDVVQASDVSAAQADKAQFLADLQANAQQLASQGLNVTQLPDFADGAVKASADVSAGGISVSANAFGFLKGTIFFGFSDVAVGGTAPSDAAMQAEASTVLGRLP